MGSSLAALQCAATVLMYAATAAAVGASTSALWIARGGSDWAAGRLPRLRGCVAVACVVALLASVAVLCFESAAMAEVPLADVAPAIKLMLSSTHYGAAWSLGAAALVAASVISLTVPRHAVRAWSIGTIAALAVFWFTRSMVSHAAGDGDFSAPVVLDWIHLALISLWIGEVFIAGLVMLPGAAPASREARQERASYIKALSDSATLSLGGIVATGLFSAWHRVDGIDGLFGSAYGRTLLAKLAVVGLAVLLGGCNRFLVMPELLAAETAGGTAAPAVARRFKLVLQVETVVLFAALILAVLLAASSPVSDAG